MPNSVEQAISNVADQSKHGPAFRVGLCKQKTREAYGVPSDGSNDATEAWGRTKHRVKTTGHQAPRGAILWWTGGSQGHGHAAIADGKGGVWSVDILRSGYWDHVPFPQMSHSWPNLRFAGVSLDIDGVQVVPTPGTEKPKPETVPTWFDITEALKKLAADTTNRTKRGLLLSAAKAVGPFVANKSTTHRPKTVGDVIYALQVKRKTAVGVAAKARITAAITLLRPLSPLK